MVGVGPVTAVRGATFGCAAGVLVAVVVVVAVEVLRAAVLLLGLDPQPATTMATARMTIPDRLINAVCRMT
jgi:hypothetical protein